MGKINSRAKGNSYELRIINLFKSLGWTEACSSRSESKRKDDAGIDICYSDPFYIQCKAVENLGSAHSTLNAMPRDRGKINLVFHKKNRAGTVVSMKMDDFVNILTKLIESGVIKPK